MMDIEQIDLEFYRWALGITHSNFTAQLFDLICKADTSNVCKLSEGFPYEVELIQRHKKQEGFTQNFIKDMNQRLHEKKGL